MTVHESSPISAALAGYKLIIAHIGREWGSVMQDAVAEMAKNSAPTSAEDRRIADQTPTLDHRYGQIGIMAVAAAVRYQGGTKNPAYAPCSTKWRDLIADVAA